MISRKHPYSSGSLNPEMPGDSENVLLHWGDICRSRSVDIPSEMLIAHAQRAADKVNSDCGLAGRVQQSAATAGKAHQRLHQPLSDTWTLLLGQLVPRCQINQQVRGLFIHEHPLCMATAATGDGFAAASTASAINQSQEHGVHRKQNRETAKAPNRLW